MYTQDLLLTAGFDADAYAFDRSSSQLMLTLSGHRSSLVGILTVSLDGASRWCALDTCLCVRVDVHASVHVRLCVSQNGECFT